MQTIKKSPTKNSLSAFDSRLCRRQQIGRILTAARTKIADAIINGKLFLIEGGTVEVCRKRNTTMKAAVDMDENQIEDHFGQCRKIRIFEIKAGETSSVASDLPLPAEMGCRSRLAPVLSNSGVTYVIAARMGAGVRNALAMSTLQEGAVSREGHEAGHSQGDHDGVCCH